MCHNPKLDELSLCSTALKNGQAIFATACANIGCEPLSTKENTEIAELQDEAKLVLAVRAAIREGMREWIREGMQAADQVVMHQFASSSAQCTGRGSQ